MSSRKGQYFSFDAIIASVIFILTFISLISYWMSVKSALDSKEDEITREAARISDALLTPGYLTDSYFMKKVNLQTIRDLPTAEDQLKVEFNSPYNVYLAVNTKEMPALITRGVAPTASARNVAHVRRIFVLYNVSTVQGGEDIIEERQAALDLYLYN